MPADSRRAPPNSSRRRQRHRAVAIERQRRLAGEDGQGILDAPAVVGDRQAACFDLDAVVAEIEHLAKFGPQRIEVIARIVEPAGRIDRHPLRRRAAEAMPKLRPERTTGDLGDEVPDRGVEQADRSGAFAVASRLLVPHQDRPDLGGIDIVPALVQVIVRLRREQARNEPLAQQRAVRVAPDRSKARPRSGAPSCARSVSTTRALAVIDAKPMLALRVLVGSATVASRMAVIFMAAASPAACAWPKTCESSATEDRTPQETPVMTDFRTIEIPVEPFTAAAFAPLAHWWRSRGCGGLRRQSQPQLGSPFEPRARPS